LDVIKIFPPFSLTLSFVSLVNKYDVRRKIKTSSLQVAKREGERLYFAPIHIRPQNIRNICYALLQNI
jgi:hypothetical protein